MFNGDRDQYIGVTHGPNEVSPEVHDAKIRRLDEAWKFYRESGSGKVLSEDRAQVVYMFAKYLTVTRGSGMGENEAVAKVGFGYEDCYSKLKSLNLTGHQEAGLWKRVESLCDFAKGIKPTRKPGTWHTSFLSDEILRLAGESDIKTEEEKDTMGNLKESLGRLQKEWDYYINQGSGKELSSEHREIVYKLAEYRVRTISGLSNPGQLPTLPGDISRSARVGLITRAINLVLIATGKKLGHWEVGQQKTGSLPEGRLMPELVQSIEQDPRYIERDFEDQRIDSY